MSTGTAVISGTYNKPQLKLYFHPSTPHADSPHRTLKEWLEEGLIGGKGGQAFWNRSLGCWVVSATGDDPDRMFSRAGFELDFSETPGTTLADIINLNELVTPISRLTANGANAMVLPRLYGFDNTKKILGAGARWDRDFKRFVFPATDALHRNAPRKGIRWDPAIIAAAIEQRGRVTTREDLMDVARKAGSAKDILEMDADDVAKLITEVGDVPDWFGLDLFPFQRIGAIAIAAGHNALFDEPGLGKTRQSIAAAAILGAKRTLITCLPVGLTGWRREVLESNLHTLGGQYPNGDVAVIRSGKKEPVFPDTGVIITSDGLLSARDDLRRRLMAWGPEVFVYDEAHRGKSYDSKRSQAVLEVGVATTKTPLPVTGTPLLANPSELAPILELSGHLGPVFGGKAAFLERYCREDGFGGYRVRKEHLPELSAKLADHVWVRRRKRDVLPDLPQTQRVPKWVDVPLTEYRKAHREVIGKLTDWVKKWRKENPGQILDEDTIHEYAASQVGLVSLLRRAAGLAKVDTVVEDIRRHVEETTELVGGKKVFTRPLIVWTQHREVSDAMAQAVPAAVAESGIIRGGVSHAERDRLVAEFQAGRIPVLVCSIAAAGVAITLTASSDMFFAESDWTPALIRQAMDRAERIGQTADRIIATTYLAEGTLDGRIQKVLKEKSKTLDIIFGDGNDVSVIDDGDDAQSSTELVESLIYDILNGTVEKP
ncbi:DEAD/DEAH box helicase [Curtobacterium sp. MCBD17_040]|uniref:DEAD/DEAH box helicase n=1 Tax=Curtobacterium sp. MCBD17_040 TaxID=2175674 RepID=UPI000DA6F27C|nr:DEAD/DEAH box helicase [Curtobacterium sp. MCBD17_040]WIB65501.1 DEAD/DEAH box helicase [Curtobacterium sp. MCBD17_040]